MAGTGVAFVEAAIGKGFTDDGRCDLLVSSVFKVVAGEVATALGAGVIRQGGIGLQGGAGVDVGIDHYVVADDDDVAAAVVGLAAVTTAEQ